MDQSAYGDEIRIRIAGPAGFGIKAAGALLSEVFAASGLNVFSLTEYPSLIKGGHNTVHLRVSAAPIHSHVMPTDVLVALDRVSVDLHVAELTEGGVVLFDSDDFALAAEDVGGRTDVCLVGLPLTTYVRDAGGEKLMRNVAALGAVLGLAAHPIDALVSALRTRFAHKPPEVAERNSAVATRASEAAGEADCPIRLAVPTPKADVPRLTVVDGNEAVGLGALAAGIGFYAAYPMTPASSLLHFMAAHGEEQGVVVKHAEDELAAMNMVVGAAWGGTRAMCATSGGGFSLMVEALGFAGVSESACVVGLFTRPGPATGMPTWTEQSDLRFAIHAAQGEFPRVVLSPGSHEQSFELAWRAFNLADELQTPVILLSDSYAAETMRTVEPFDSSAVSISRGRLVADGEAILPAALVEGRYARYAPAEDGVSIRVLPGVPGAVQLVNSYEHDEFGYGAAGEDAATRVRQNEKRLAKLEKARDLVPAPKHHGADRDALVSILCFGSTTMVVREALSWLERDGVACEALQVVTLWPFPDAEVSAFLDGARISLCVEGNATGQLEGLVRERCLRSCDHKLHRFDGRPISPDQVYAEVRGLIGEGSDDA